jgi:hypothetical protein
MNLCLNKRDAMPGGGRLLIATEMADLDEAYCRLIPFTTPGRYAVLSVSDTGMGMNPETRDRIFEPFFATKKNGMGLATASMASSNSMAASFTYIASWDREHCSECTCRPSNPAVNPLRHSLPMPPGP